VRELHLKMSPSASRLSACLPSTVLLFLLCQAACHGFSVVDSYTCVAFTHLASTAQPAITMAIAKQHCCQPSGFPLAVVNFQPAADESMWSGITSMVQKDEAAGVQREVELRIVRRG
jgi:hypothetical protein